MRQVLIKVLWLLGYAVCAALPLAVAGILFARNLPTNLPANSLFMPSWSILSVIAAFLLVCGGLGFVCTRSTSVRLQDIGNSLKVSSLWAAGMFVFTPMAVWAVRLLPLK